MNASFFHRGRGKVLVVVVVERDDKLFSIQVWHKLINAVNPFSRVFVAQRESLRGGSVVNTLVICSCRLCSQNKDCGVANGQHTGNDETSRCDQLDCSKQLIAD